MSIAELLVEIHTAQVEWLADQKVSDSLARAEEHVRKAMNHAHAGQRRAWVAAVQSKERSCE